MVLPVVVTAAGRDGFVYGVDFKTGKLVLLVNWFTSSEQQLSTELNGRIIN